ncbi:hypothetical protein [Bacillus sp. FJAT-27445]|uniref:hypothetical protein n=1 Tax=Bacillus sp. FJAT-27445 TaxID=1679166 RepID=UPI0007441515|nr:hypothetical protein [Bacillus sp. FJAT-27445]
MLKRNKPLIIYFAVAVLFVFLMMLVSNPTLSKEREINLKFADHFISYVIDDENGVVFNLFAVQDVRKRNTDLDEMVTSVKFNNSNIEVVDFKVETGMVHKGNKLVNMQVKARVLTDLVEMADLLLIQFSNGKTVGYGFGEMAVQNGDSFERGHLVPSGGYTAGYPSAGLNVEIKNRAEQSVTGLKIEDVTGAITHQFDDGLKIEPMEVVQIDVNGFGMKEYDFTMISPILTYNLQEVDFRYNMPGVMHGVSVGDEAKIKRIVD